MSNQKKPATIYIAKPANPRSDEIVVYHDTWVVANRDEPVLIGFEISDPDHYLPVLIERAGAMDLACRLLREFPFSQSGTENNVKYTVDVR